MRKFSKKTWFEELNEDTRAEYLVEGPVKVKFSAGDVILKMNVKVRDNKESVDSFFVETEFETVLCPPDYHNKMRLANEMLNIVGRENKKEAQWRVFCTTDEALARAKLLPKTKK